MSTTFLWAVPLMAVGMLGWAVGGVVVILVARDIYQRRDLCLSSMRRGHGSMAGAMKNKPAPMGGQPARTGMIPCSARNEPHFTPP